MWREYDVCAPVCSDRIGNSVYGEDRIVRAATRASARAYLRKISLSNGSSPRWTRVRKFVRELCE